MLGYTYFLSQENRIWNLSLSPRNTNIKHHSLWKAYLGISEELQGKQASAGVLQMGRQKKLLAEHHKGIQQTPVSCPENCTLNLIVGIWQILQHVSLSTCQPCQGRQA